MSEINFNVIILGSNQKTKFLVDRQVDRGKDSRRMGGDGPVCSALHATLLNQLTASKHLSWVLHLKDPVGFFLRQITNKIFSTAGSCSSSSRAWSGKPSHCWCPSAALDYRGVDGRSPTCLSSVPGVSTSPPPSLFSKCEQLFIYDGELNWITVRLMEKPKFFLAWRKSWKLVPWCSSCWLAIIALLLQGCRVRKTVRHSATATWSGSTAGPMGTSVTTGPSPWWGWRGRQEVMTRETDWHCSGYSGPQPCVDSKGRTHCSGSVLVGVRNVWVDNFPHCHNFM